jgi:hypothetical protein
MKPAMSATAAKGDARSLCAITSAAMPAQGKERRSGSEEEQAGRRLRNVQAEARQQG